MDSKQIIRRYYQVLISFFVVIVLIIGAMVAVYLFVENDDTMTNINIILLLVLLVIAILYKSIIQGYRNLAQVAKVVLNQSKPIKYKTNILENKKHLVENEYELFANNEFYSIYYKYINERIKKIFKIKNLKTIVLINDSQTSYYSKNVHDEIEKLENEQVKKGKYNKHMILVFKEFEGFTKDDIKEIGEVVSYGTGRQFFTQINVGFNKKDKKCYFLYSEKYYPTNDYRELVEEIKAIIR